MRDYCLATDQKVGGSNPLTYTIEKALNLLHFKAFLFSKNKQSFGIFGAILYIFRHKSVETGVETFSQI